MKSMTGFGRASYRDAEAEIFIEIKTVNHRYRDFFMKIPRILSPVEEKIKARIAETLRRGRIEVFIKYNALTAENKKLVFNRGLAEEYVEILKEIHNLDFNFDDKLEVGLVARFPEVVTVEDDFEDYEALYHKLLPLLDDALAQVDRSRSVEGEALAQDILANNEEIAATVDKIAELSGERLAQYEVELKEKIAKLTDNAELDERRVMTEIAIMADRLTIDEELTRLGSHTQRLREIVADVDEAQGRKLDFLIQEFNREVNTIGSKASNVEISALVVDLKSAIEKIREQVQNIE